VRTTPLATLCAIFLIKTHLLSLQGKLTAVVQGCPHRHLSSLHATDTACPTPCKPLCISMYKRCRIRDKRVQTPCCGP
jgi:hypothetical protein